MKLGIPWQTGFGLKKFPSVHITFYNAVRKVYLVPIQYQLYFQVEILDPATISIIGFLTTNLFICLKVSFCSEFTVNLKISFTYGLNFFSLSCQRPVYSFNEDVSSFHVFIEI